MFCTNCGAKSEADDMFCGQCGAKLAVTVPPNSGENAAMFCTNCGTKNEAGNVFCGHCGARLTATEALPPPMDIDSRAEMAMLRPPEDEMRPLTRVAYGIHDSEQHMAVSGALNVLFVGLCLGIVANLIAIFDKMNKLTQSLKTSGETYLSQTIYEQIGGEHTMGLVWLCLLFALLVLLFIAVGKLKLRLKKIRRKERKFKAKGIYVDVPKC